MNSAAMSLLPHLTYETGPSPRHAVIWLHGLGADGGDFVPVAKAMQLPAAVRYVFPHAPERPVTINGGYVMRAWYDIVAADLSTGPASGTGRRPDEAGIRASQAEVEKLIEQETQRGVAAQNIFLAGFSQGGAIILHTGLRHAERLGGLLALSTYLPLAESAAAEIAPAARGTPVFMAHGFDDSVIPLESGKRSAEKLVELGCAVEWHEYAMPHSVCQEEVRDIETWLARRMAGS